ncbi:MAG TPA: hypothetical protein PLZ05_01720 [Alphaproteobacteria bacterium]|nr:hypothetical protein [Alphaproteobacteria bacterium]
MPKIISVHSWESTQFQFEIFNLETDQGSMKIYAPQLITQKESVVEGNYIFFCNQVCKKSGGKICTEHPLLKNRKCSGQFFYIFENDIMNNKQK